MSRTTDSASFDVMFDALRDPYRRRILLAVADHNPRDEDEFTPDEVGSADAEMEELEHLELELFHSHLPKLAEKGYIEWNPETQTIRRGPNFDDIAPLLKLMDDHADELLADWP